ncbi:MAG TPA: nuclear transport factor 2 family protein [Pyrinomonadaceae bacterium]|jgi:ketosteroid isomerase-like protein
MPHIYFVNAFALVLVFVALAGAQEKTKPARNPVDRVEQIILQLEHETMEAIKNKDTEALSRILAEDFIFRSPAGPDLTRDQFLNSIKAFPVKVQAIWGEELKVKVYDQTAVLTGVQRARTASTEGKEEETSAGAFTDIFIRRKGRWLLVLAYSVDLQPTRQPSKPELPTSK